MSILNDDEYFQYLKDHITKYGLKSEYSLHPTIYQPYDKKYGEVSDFLFKEYGFTHYKLNDEDKTEIICLKGDSFGACSKLEFKFSRKII